MADRCDECQHWLINSPNEEWEAKGAGFGQCCGILERWRIMDDPLEEIAYETDPAVKLSGEEAENYVLAQRLQNLKDARAYVQDGSQFRADLFTAPDFFCALFERKAA